MQTCIAIKLGEDVVEAIVGVCRYQEKFYFNPGDTGFQVFSTKYGKIGVAICWDQWFPEAARCMALKGAEVGFHVPPAFRILLSIDLQQFRHVICLN